MEGARWFFRERQAASAVAQEAPQVEPMPDITPKDSLPPFQGQDLLTFEVIFKTPNPGTRSMSLPWRTVPSTLETVVLIKGNPVRLHFLLLLLTRLPRPRSLAHFYACTWNLAA